jgi:hypothetical protein
MIGISDSSSVVRYERNKVTGRTNHTFQATRYRSGKQVSINSADPGLLIGKR